MKSTLDEIATALTIGLVGGLGWGIALTLIMLH